MLFKSLFEDMNDQDYSDSELSICESIVPITEEILHLPVDGLYDSGAIDGSGLAALIQFMLYFCGRLTESAAYRERSENEHSKDSNDADPPLPGRMHRAGPLCL
jgi:hypothetical protein